MSKILEKIKNEQATNCHCVCCCNCSDETRRIIDIGFCLMIICIFKRTRCKREYKMSRHFTLLPIIFICFFCLSPCSFSGNRYLNESSVLNVLRQRYGNNLIHTYAGPSIININPMANLAIYSEKIIQMFKECQLEDMPPHIYSVAQQVRYFEFSSSFFS